MTMRAFLMSLTAAAFAAAVLSGSANAHHGWSWTTGKNIKLTGIIDEVRLGNPHGILTVKVEDEVWTVEVGQPWRNERAGLKEGDFAKGVEATFYGEPSADIKDRRLKVERLEIGERSFDLYPGRD